MLFSFAQFEREMISERTKDKMRAARRKGKWVGGNLVLGYDLSPKGGSLTINRDEADRVREIFRLYLEIGSLIPLIAELERRGWKMKTWTTREGREAGGARFTKTTLYNLLTNVIYTGRVKYEGELLDGEHDRIVEDETWNRVREQLNRNGRRGGRNVRNKHGALLKGLLKCASCNCGMTHTYVQKKDNRLYRYYVCINAHQRGWNNCDTRSVSAPVLEGAVVDQIRGIAQRPEILSEVLRRIEQDRQLVGGPGTPRTDPGDVRAALAKFDPLWDQLNTWQQEQFIRALVKEVRYDGPTGTVTVGFLTEGIKGLCQRSSKE
jgi:site-specific DNA recombinase